MRKKYGNCLIMVLQNHYFDCFASIGTVIKTEEVGILWGSERMYKTYAYTNVITSFTHECSEMCCLISKQLDESSQ